MNTVARGDNGDNRMVHISIMTSIMACGIAEKQTAYKSKCFRLNARAEIKTKLIKFKRFALAREAVRCMSVRHAS